jgi:hypothetical protein
MAAPMISAEIGIFCSWPPASSADGDLDLGVGRRHDLAAFDHARRQRFLGGGVVELHRHHQRVLAEGDVAQLAQRRQAAVEIAGFRRRLGHSSQILPPRFRFRHREQRELGPWQTRPRS